MHRARYIVIALVALLVAVAWPAAVVAQSAGEDQYEDPLPGNSGSGGDSGGGSGGGGSSGGGSGGGSAGGGDPSAGSAGVPSEDTTPTQQAEPSQAAPRQDGLPRTGFPVAMLFIAGAAMIASGFSLRRNA
jgi:hypothetical protein